MSVATHTQPKPRVLFIDDSRLMRMCARKILGQQFELQLAESAEQGWEILCEDEGIQVVFTDLHMTGKSGYELLRMVRNSDSPRLAELPVVLITGAEDKEDKRSHALTLGATDFITKPFEASELLARASSHADSGQSRRRLRQLESEHHLDPDTGLGNRSYCRQRLTEAMSFARRHDQALSLMHLQLEGLGRLIDDLGPTHGRRAMTNIGRTLKARIRREDTLYRSGRDCFTFILPATDIDGARRLRHRFVPDLESLGMGESAEALDVRVRFSVQEPALDGTLDADAVLREGLAAELEEIEPRPARPPSAPADTAAEPHARSDPRPGPGPSVDRALELLAEGRSDVVQKQLGALREQLEPLLTLLLRRPDPASEDSESTPSDSSDGNVWRID